MKREETNRMNIGGPAHMFPNIAVRISQNRERLEKLENILGKPLIKAYSEREMHILFGQRDTTSEAMQESIRSNKELLDQYFKIKDYFFNDVNRLRDIEYASQVRRMRGGSFYTYAGIGLASEEARRSRSENGFRLVFQEKKK